MSNNSQQTEAVPPFARPSGYETDDCASRLEQIIIMLEKANAEHKLERVRGAKELENAILENSRLEKKLEQAADAIAVASNFLHNSALEPGCHPRVLESLRILNDALAKVCQSHNHTIIRHLSDNNKSHEKPTP